MNLLLRQPRPFHLLLLALVLLASVFGRPDIPIDETRYVSVAWEMWQNGDWLVPHKNGLPYHHKPPLLFWLINLGWMAFGVNEWWPRAISALFSLACLPLTAAIAARLWPHEGGIGDRVGWFLIGGVFWLFFSTSVIFDVMLTAFVLLALLAALRAAGGERFGTWGLFGLAVGLGILSKGPVILLHILPALLLAPWWSRARRSWKGWYAALTVGVLIGAVVALAWAIPAALRGGEEFRNAIFWGQTAGRVSGSLAHKQPFWFYLAALPLLLFPWFFWVGAWRAFLATLDERGEARDGVRFCMAWLLPALIGFSFVGGKQLHYILPLLPAFALLLALGSLRVSASGRLAALPVALATAALGGVILQAQNWAAKLWLAPYVGADWAIGGVLLIVLAIGMLIWVRGVAAGPRLALLSGVLTVICLLCLLRPLSPVFDTRPMGERLKVLENQGIPIANAGAYNDQYQFYGRLLRPLQEISRAEIPAWLEKHPQGRVVTTLKRAQDAAALRPEFWQPYLEGAAVLIDGEAAKRLAGTTEQ